MFYPALKFSRKSGRPTFYSNFVSTLDGKVAIYGKDAEKYWPLGSKLDYEVLTELRGYADVLLHGKVTASTFSTVKGLARPTFAALRKKLGKRQPLLYIVVSASPDKKLLQNLKNREGVRPLLLTTKGAKLPAGAEKVVDILRLGTKAVDLKALSRYLYKKGIRRVLLEGGPNTLGSFFAAGLVDEIFLTVAPKVLGGRAGKTATMVEGMVFKADKVKRFQLASMKKAGDELFLRYAGKAS